MSASAPSPVTLHAVPKLSCKAKMAIKSAVPIASKPSTLITMPKEAITVPPGTPGAPTANTPNKNENKIIIPIEGTEPYSICEMVIAKKVSVNTEPHKCVVAPSGIAKSTMSGGKTEDLCAQRKATGKVAALDIVPTAVA